MINQISYLPILGLPLNYWLGLLALVLIICAAATQFLAKKRILILGLKWHKGFAVTGIIIGCIHGLLGLINYL
jgi:hypothetical protein